MFMTLRYAWGLEFVGHPLYELSFPHLLWLITKRSLCGETGRNFRHHMIARPQQVTTSPLHGGNRGAHGSRTIRGTGNARFRFPAVLEPRVACSATGQGAETTNVNYRGKSLICSLNPK